MLGVVVDPDDPAVVLAERRVPTPEGGAGSSTPSWTRCPHSPSTRGRRRPSAWASRVSWTATACCTWAPHLRRMHDLPLAASWRMRPGVPTVVDNDANCHAVAEQPCGAASGHGGGAGRHASARASAPGSSPAAPLLRGANGFAGEPGHMIVDPNGPPCPCGKRGCWERFASGTGLGRLARDAAHGGRLDAVVAARRRRSRCGPGRARHGGRPGRRCRTRWPCWSRAWPSGSRSAWPTSPTSSTPRSS